MPPGLPPTTQDMIDLLQQGVDLSQVNIVLLAVLIGLIIASVFYDALRG